MKKKALYIDMDGTLARFHDADKMFIEAMWTEGFYVNLKPFENFVDAVKLFIERHPDVDVYVLSAVLDTEPPFVVGEKNQWLDKFLPEIDIDHRIFTRAGEDKSKYIDMSSCDCFLVDDFNKNLYEFEDAGGKSIKFRNDINHRGRGEFGGSKGALWSGNIVGYDKPPEVTCMNLEGLLGLIKGYEKFVFEDDILVDYQGDAESVVIPEGVAVIDKNVFWNHENLKSVQLPGSLQTVLSGAFAGCANLQEITLPEDLRTIEKNAFIGCSSLKNVRIPASVFFLHSQAFDWCENLSAIDVDEKNDTYFSVDGMIYKYDKDLTEHATLIRCPCGASGDVVLANNVHQIGPGAFQNCGSITNVTLPEHFFAAGNRAFANCVSIEKVVLPSLMSDLGKEVFAGCSNLKSVTMPDNLLRMGSGVFEDCKNLSEIIISDEALYWYCEKFNFLDEVFMLPCYAELKERYDALVKLAETERVDDILADAKSRVDNRPGHSQPREQDLE